MTVTIGSFNILHPYYAIKFKEPSGIIETDGGIESNWKERCPLVCKSIQYVDIACLQEVSTETIHDIEKDLKEYQIASLSFHSNSSLKKKYGNMIFFRNDKVTFLDRFEVRHNLQNGYRVASGAVFRLEEYTLAVMSVHLTGYDADEKDLKRKDDAREKGFHEMETYVKKLNEISKEYTVQVFAGDLNEDPQGGSHPFYRLGYIERLGYQSDGNLTPTEHIRGNKIDWIYAKSNDPTVALLMTPLYLEKKQTPASDHLMTGSRLRIILKAL